MGTIVKIRKYLQDYGVSYTIKKLFYRFWLKYWLGGRLYPVKLSRKERQKQENRKFSQDIRISILVPLYNTPPSYLREMLDSVFAQTYSRWELCLVDAGDAGRSDTEKIVREYQQIPGGERVKYRRLPENRGISCNTNAALAMATGSYIGLMDHDDILHPSALYWVVQEIEEQRADFVYTDELSFVGKTQRVQSVHLKPDFSPESLRSNNYICHFTVFLRELLAGEDAFRQEMDGAQDYDLFLRLTSRTENIRHIPRVLYYWRIHEASSASGVDAKPYIVEAGKQALANALEREGLAGEVIFNPLQGPFYRIFYQVPDHTRVCVLVPEEEMAEKIRQRTDQVSYSVSVRTASEIHLMEKGEYDTVVLLRWGYVPSAPMEGLSWLTELLGCLQRKETVAVSSLVLEQNDRISHAGYTFDRGFPDRIRPLYRGIPAKDPGYMNHLKYRQNVSLLGGAVLAVTSSLFSSYIEERKKKNGREIDCFSDLTWFSLCLLGREEGGGCVLTPYALFRKTEKEGDHSQGDECYQGKISWEKPVWQEFLADWHQNLAGTDPHSNPGMKKLGTYYFLW